MTGIPHTSLDEASWELQFGEFLMNRSLKRALGALFIYEFVVFAIDGWTGHVLFGPLRWLQILTGALLWPLAAALLGRSHAPR